MEKLTVEKALDRLNEITEALENDENDLMEIIALYEEGIKLIHQSREILSEAELKISELTKQGKVEFKGIPQ